MLCKCVNNVCFVCQHVAAATGSVQVVKALLKAGAKNSKNKCVVLGFVGCGWPAVVALTCRLLACSLARARVASRTGKIPLDVAVGAGVKKLLEA